jgi:hypothetical protein
VAYFAKAPLPGLVKTRLVPPLTHAEAAGLYGGFLAAVLRPVPGASTYVYGWPADALGAIVSAAPDRGSGLIVRPQVGADLWARMRQCFADLFAAGHAPVLIRNTDSPDLPAAVVAQALLEAAPGRVVLGPDAGGGYYLIALAAPCPQLLGAAVEGSDEVLAATRRRALDHGLEVRLLPVHGDVDTYADLLAMWTRRSAVSG